MRSNRVSLTLFVLLCGIVSFIACSKYKDTNPPSTDLPADKAVIATIQGRVLDENGVPVMSAVVRGGGKDTTTDVNGGFLFNNIQVSSRFGYVKVQKPGYFTAGRSVITNAGGTNYVTISLIPRTAKGSFTAASGGTIVVQAGDTVVFDPASVVNDVTKAAYTGTVHVYAAYLDPTDINLPRTMPGDLRGIGKDGKETALQTFGMMVVELEGDAGEKLQLAAGKTAALTMAIPASMQATTPASMPLWYFNDTTGKWIEQGTATRKGNSLCGTTSHFTYWNWAMYFNAVLFNVSLKDPQGHPLIYTRIQFTSSTGDVRGSFTDQAGNANGMLPQGQSMLFQVLNACGSPVFGENLGPVLANQDLGTLTVDPDNAVLTLTGTVKDCSNNAVATGYVNVLLEGLSYRAPITDGAFSLEIARCSGSTADAQVTAMDLGAQQTGKTVTVSVKSGPQDLGILSACGVTISQLIKVTVNGIDYTWSDPPDQFGYQSNYINANSSATGNHIEMIMSPPLSAAGTFDFLYFSVYGPSVKFGGMAGNVNAIHCEITAFGPVAGNVTGIISGNVYDSVALKSYPITGSLMVKRTR